MTSPLPDAWLSIEQIATVFHVNTRTIRRYINAYPPLIHPRTETRGGRNYRKIISVQEVAAIPGLHCDRVMLDAILHSSAQTILERLSEVEIKLQRLQLLTRQDVRETASSTQDEHLSPFTVVPAPGAAQGAAGVAYVAGVKIEYYEGIVSKNCCVKLAAAHGAGYAGADKWRWPMDQRATPEAVVRFIQRYMTRERSPLRFRLCDDPGCPCHGAEGDGSS